MADVPSAEDLVSLFQKGLLAIQMARRFGLDDESELRAAEARCVELHETGALDLIALVESGAIQALDESDFFMASHLFCRLAPQLNTTSKRMMTCIEALVTRGGNDGA